MNDHDIVSVADCSVTCACGRTFVGSSLDQAKRIHANHFGVQQARTALRGVKT